MSISDYYIIISLYIYTLYITPSKSTLFNDNGMTGSGKWGMGDGLLFSSHDSYPLSILSSECCTSVATNSDSRDNK